MNTESFPENFIWGSATASYQIEGAAFDDGKGLSVWDMMCRWEGKIKNNDTGDVACDFYHKYKEDIALMKELGMQAFRFSVSWPRVLPDGIGKINQKGLDFYDKVVDELLNKNIEPFITLFHWDYPYELYRKGDLLNDDSPEWFAEFTKVVVDKLSDRVKNWMTVNEPQCYVGLGHYVGMHAPGVKLDKPEIMKMWHNMLLSHGRAVQSIRANAKLPSNIGTAPCARYFYPADENNENDIAAAKNKFFECDDLWGIAMWLDPICFGKYPSDALEKYSEIIPKINAEDLKIISTPIDFIGYNLYQGSPIKDDGNGNPIDVPFKPGKPITLFDWDITPRALRWTSNFLYERYKKPIYITENGMSNIDWVSLDGKVHDPQRIDFLNRYIRELKKAIDDGADVRGYFVWSFMDNFEWAEGYKHRFGLVHINYETLKRTVKDSAFWYKKVIETNGKFLFDALSD